VDYQGFCRGGLSRLTLQALVALFGNLKKENGLRQQFKWSTIARKIEILIQILP